MSVSMRYGEGAKSYYVLPHENTNSRQAATSNDFHHNKIGKSQSQPNPHPCPDKNQLNQENSILRVANETKILIGEADNDLLMLFRDYFSALGMTSVTAGSGRETLDWFIASQRKERPYDFIMLDTHLSNPSGLEIAKRIRREKPDQKLVMITTTPKENLPQECLKIARLEEKDIFTIPFKLSKLLEVLEN
jgi:two-component system, OmpR family, response regulator